MTAARDAAIGAEGLVRDFPAVRAVDGIDLAVERGQVFGFLGANGSGKTTTIRMLTTLLRPTAGRGYVDGLDVQREASEVRRRIGVALQEAGLDDLQTGRELLALQGRLHGVRRGEIAARVDELLAIVDLEDAADRRIGTYSGGMQRRLDLASALVHRPGIVFLDEPTTGLDPISRDAVWRYVEQLNRDEGVTFFLTTQYLEEADRLADEVAIIDAGRIVAQGSPADLKATIGADVVTIHVDADDGAGIARALLRIEELDGLEEVRTLDEAIVVYITDGSRAIARLVTLVQDSGLAVREVTLAQPTLDDVFLRATGRHLEVDAEAPSPGAGEEETR
ncbi:MAG: ATP-binding cassette domain-containing protein [Chloroflexi bacterium]|nr:ATP-binding cassette domain-containing protein [Chloroflexota bacterium]